MVHASPPCSLVNGFVPVDTCAIDRIAGGVFLFYYGTLFYFSVSSLHPSAALFVRTCTDALQQLQPYEPSVPQYNRVPDPFIDLTYLTLHVCRQIYGGIAIAIAVTMVVAIVGFSRVSLQLSSGESLRLPLPVLIIQSFSDSCSELVLRHSDRFRAVTYHCYRGSRASSIHGRCLHDARFAMHYS